MYTLYAYIKWGDIESDLSIESIPREVEAARSLWQAKGEDALDEICALIQPFICCQLVAENFPEWQEYFDDSEFGEFSANVIKVSGVDFSQGSLPSIKAEAWIEVALAENKAPDDVDQWMEEIDDTLGWGVVFGWDFACDDEFDLTMVDHRGIDTSWD